MKNRTQHGTRILTLLGLLALAAGCATTKDIEKEELALAKAQLYFEEGRLTEAISECIELSRKDPFLPGLAVLQNKIMTKITQERNRVTAIREPTAVRRMSADVEDRKTVPDTYGLRIPTRGESAPFLTPTNAMEQLLQRRVTVRLDNVNIDDFVLAIGASESVNIITDSSLSAGGTMTIHAENVPLAEILDYVSRNLGISFYVGQNIIWATAGQKGKPGVPLETRMYRLRKGLSAEELTSGNLNIMEAIQRFVPKADGSDLLFNRKAHVLITRDTRDNLARIENLIAALDVCPPQVLIEARFLTTGVNDLREIGVDWVLNSPIGVTKKTLQSGSSATKRNATQIDKGASVSYSKSDSSSQGLNLTYTGVLTDPMFQATLHALETSGKTRTLSIPRVTTVNNKPAVIRIGEDFRYFEQYDVQTVVDSSASTTGQTIYKTVLVPVGTPQMEELGIELNVTPSVGADLRSIELSLVPEISDLARFEYYDTAAGSAGSSTTTTTTTNTATTAQIKLPIFRRSRIETEVIVQSGETVVMGGLITSSESDSEKRIPFISYIPIIGKLFRQQGVEEKKENLLVFVTATILSERGEDLVPVVETVATAPAPLPALPPVNPPPAETP